MQTESLTAGAVLTLVYNLFANGPYLGIARREGTLYVTMRTRAAVLSHPEGETEQVCLEINICVLFCFVFLMNIYSGLHVSSMTSQGMPYTINDGLRKWKKIEDNRKLAGWTHTVILLPISYLYHYHLSAMFS